MNPTVDTIVSSPARDRLAERVCAGLFFATLALVTAKTLFHLPLLNESNWPEALLLLSAVAAAVTAMARQLPLQNVLLAGAIIGMIGGIAQTIGTLTGVPFGPYIYTANTGPQAFDTLPWAIPLVWVLAIFTSRGVARLILRPWRKMRVYGLWLIGITAALSLALDLGLEIFAAHCRDYWLWQPTRFPASWYGTPLTHFLGWLATALIILAFATPALIRKKAGPSPPEHFPMVVWMSLAMLFAISALSMHFWFAAAVEVVVATAALILAFRGAKW